MPSLIDIRRRIRSVKNTQQITKAMKMVSAAKLRRAQERVIAARPYATLLERMLSNVAAAAADNEDEVGLQQKVLNRKAKHEEVLATLDALKMKLRQEQEEAVTYQQLAQIEQTSTMSTMLAVQVGTGYIPVVSFLRKRYQRPESCRC